MNPLVGHRFAHPQLPDAEMALICYKNGSLCREWIRNKYCEGTWDKFEEMVRNAAAASTSTNNTNLGFYFPQKEISPKVEGVFRFQKQQGSSSEFDLVAEFSDPTVTPLTLLESQFLGMRIDCLSLGIDISSSSSASRVYVSGGASQNATLLQIMANCFDTQVWCVEGSTSAAAFGGAVRAWYATEHAADSSLGFEHFCQKYAVGTDRKADVYRPLLASRERYAQLFKNVQRLRSGNVVQMGAW